MKASADGRPLEQSVQRQVVALFRAHGCTVYTTSQYRASHVSEGIADLYCLHPRGWAWWFEVKRPRRHKGFERYRMETWLPDLLSPRQVAFGDECARCGVRYAWGGYNEAVALLKDLGLWKGLET